MSQYAVTMEIIQLWAICPRYERRRQQLTAINLQGRAAGEMVRMDDFVTGHLWLIEQQRRAISFSDLTISDGSILICTPRSAERAKGPEGKF